MEIISATPRQKGKAKNDVICTTTLVGVPFPSGDEHDVEITTFKTGKNCLTTYFQWGSYGKGDWHSSFSHVIFQSKQLKRDTIFTKLMKPEDVTRTHAEHVTSFIQNGGQLP